MEKYIDEKTENIGHQYIEFKLRLNKIVFSNKDYSEIIDRFKHLLFEVQSCTMSCEDNCSKKGKVTDTSDPLLFPLLHLILKEPSLFHGIQDFLHLYLRCLVKTHAEGVAESMGNYMDIHGDKRRGSMDIENLGQEAFIHWNGPPLHLADHLGKKSLDRYFKKSSWNFITQKHKSQSTVISRIKKMSSRVPFF